MNPCDACGRLHNPDRPNIAHYYRPTRRHQWRTNSTTVNASPCSVPTLRVGLGGQYADIPYDPDVWKPARTARQLPGITPAMLDMVGG